jgi:hypothetical protein
MNTRGIESPRAGANRQFSVLEMAKESVPFSIGWGAIFFAWAGGSAAGDERPVCFECFCGIGSLVTHSGRDRGVPDNDLSDVWR